MAALGSQTPAVTLLHTTQQALESFISSCNVYDRLDKVQRMSALAAEKTARQAPAAIMHKMMSSITCTDEVADITCFENIRALMAFSTDSNIARQAQLNGQFSHETGLLLVKSFEVDMAR
jgi:hypothetical protein